MDRTYTILLVAGNAMIIRGFEHFIRALGHETRGAATSSKAQALMADIQPACILLDMHLDEGGLPGLQVIPRLHRKAPNAVIVAMSADASWNPRGRRAAGRRLCLLAQVRRDDRARSRPGRVSD